MGYLPIDRDDANLFFQLIARRYEKKSTVITTNVSLSKWKDMFVDAMVANAILDRNLHHSKMFVDKRGILSNKGLLREEGRRTQ